MLSSVSTRMLAVISFYRFRLDSGFTFARGFVQLLFQRGLRLFCIFRWTFSDCYVEEMVSLSSQLKSESCFSEHTCWRHGPLTAPLWQQGPDFNEDLPCCQICHYTCTDRTKRTKFGAMSPLQTVHNLLPFEKLNQQLSIAIIRLSFFKLQVTLIVPRSV